MYVITLFHRLFLIPYLKAFIFLTKALTYTTSAITHAITSPFPQKRYWVGIDALMVGYIGWLSGWSTGVTDLLMKGVFYKEVKDVDVGVAKR